MLMNQMITPPTIILKERTIPHLTDFGRMQLLELC